MFAEWAKRAAGAALGLAMLAGPVWAEFQTLSGSVTYREKIMMPEGALVEVTLEDISLADAKSTVLSSITIKPEASVPVPFEMSYDDAMVDERHRYAVRALIRVGSDVVWRTTEVFPALTHGAPESVDVVVMAMAEAKDMELSGTNWNVVGLNGEPVSGGGAPTLLFNTEGRASGSTGCNIFTGTYTKQGDKLSFGPLASTRKACLDETAQLENTYLKALARVSRVQADGRQLVLRAADGTPLIALVAQ